MESNNNLPDIPYTPLQEDTGQEQAMETPPQKRSRAHTAAERKARSCSKQSTEEKEEAKEKKRQAIAKKRADDTFYRAVVTLKTCSEVISEIFNHEGS